MNIRPVMLFAAEVRSLGRLASGVARKTIPVPHVDKLVFRGLARCQAGELIVTTLGHATLVVELTRASWADAPA